MLKYVFQQLVRKTMKTLEGREYQDLALWIQPLSSPLL
jgi:hypothetical protein